MAGHGWVNQNADGARARCGGPALCGECRDEFVAIYGIGVYQNRYGKPATTYRVGNKLGRTVYRNDKLIGVMDTAEDAALVVEALNARVVP